MSLWSAVVVSPPVEESYDWLLIRKFETSARNGHPFRDIQGLEGRFAQGVNLHVPRSVAGQVAHG